jgi:hypothetical protein
MCWYKNFRVLREKRLFKKLQKISLALINLGMQRLRLAYRSKHVLSDIFILGNRNMYVPKLRSLTLDK